MSAQILTAMSAVHQPAAIDTVAALVLVALAVSDQLLKVAATCLEEGDQGVTILVGLGVIMHLEVEVVGVDQQVDGVPVDRTGGQWLDQLAQVITAKIRVLIIMF
jgi:hypothetical protein